MTAVSMVLHILVTMVAAAAMGFVMSTGLYQNIQEKQSFLIPKFPKYTEHLRNNHSLVFWRPGTPQLFLISEVLFSFIYCFTTMALVYSKKAGGAGEGAGLSELKRFISGTLVYLGRGCVGERPTLHLGFTAMCAGYLRSPQILFIFGLGNVIGWTIAFVLFKIQLAGGALSVILEYITLAPSFLFIKKQEENPEPSGTRKQRATRNQPTSPPSTEMPKHSRSRSIKEEVITGPKKRTTIPSSK